MRWPSIFVLVRSDLHARWLGLIALGVLAGVVGALAVGSLSVARRTDTAVTRLSETAGVGDALVNVYGDTSIAAGIADLDSVSTSVLLPTWVGLLDGPELQPIALLADDGAERPFFHPTIVEGRAVAEGAADEVVMFESFARQTGVGVGTELTLHLLGFEQSFRFGEGLGDPEGPTVHLKIVGTMRTSGVADQMPPLVAGPAFAQQYADDQVGIAFAAVQLHGGPAAAPQLEAELQALRATASPVPGLADTAVDVAYPDRAGDDSARSSQRLLVSGLLAFAAVVIGAGLLSLGQAMARLHEGTRARAGVEAALGLTATERTMVRAIPGTIVVTLAALVAGFGALAAGVFEPLGALRTYEPSPGFAPNLAIAGLGVEERRGQAGWTLAEGSYPATENEIVLGPRAAATLDRGIGDVVTVAGGADGTLDLRVVGIGLGPDSSGGQLGSRVLLAPESLTRLVEQPSVEALVRTATAADADAVLADFAGTAEVHARSVPAEITNLDEVGTLPILLAAFLALVGVSALANGLVVAVRRRRSTIAVLRTMGFTPGQSATTILTMTSAVALTAIVIGLPLGLLLGAQLWRGIATRAAVAPAVSAPTLSILAIGVGGLVVALAVAVVPAWRAARLRPAEILREP